MEIRQAPYPLPSPAQRPQPQPPAVAQAAGEATPARQGRSAEYVSQGELLEKQGASDYRDLIRAARQQRATGQRELPAASHTAQAQRALDAYQGNGSAPAAGPRHIDDFV